MTITLDRVYIHDAANPSDYVTIRVSEWSDNIKVKGGRRERASGRTVIVTQAITTNDIPFKAPMVTRSTYESLKGYLGKRLMLRDSRGRVVWGGILDLQANEFRPSNALAEVSFTFIVAGTQSSEV